MLNGDLVAISLGRKPGTINNILNSCGNRLYRMRGYDTDESTAVELMYTLLCVVQGRLMTIKSALLASPISKHNQLAKELCPTPKAEISIVNTFWAKTEQFKQECEA